MKLKVIQLFASYKVGDEITRDSEIKSILNSEQSQYVVAVQSDPPAKPVAQKE